VIVPRTWNALTHAHTGAHTNAFIDTHTHTHTHKRARARLCRGTRRWRESAARSPEETIDKRKRKNVKIMDCAVKNRVVIPQGHRN